MRTLERLHSLIDYLARRNSIKPLNTLNDQELKELMHTLGLSHIKIDSITVEAKLEKMAEYFRTMESH